MSTGATPKLKRREVVETVLVAADFFDARSGEKWLARMLRILMDPRATFGKPYKLRARSLKNETEGRVWIEDLVRKMIREELGTSSGEAQRTMMNESLRDAVFSQAVDAARAWMSQELRRISRQLCTNCSAMFRMEAVEGHAYD